jgi:hypothetical protein
MPTEQDVKKFTATVEEAVTYPILTQETSGYGTGGDGNGGAGAAGSTAATSLTRTAQQTIRQVLGWRYRAEDQKGFLAALTKAFSLREVDGHIESEWKAQSYMLQADLGEITGAQASVHKQAQVALEQALPLLDGLTPLRTDADEEDIEAMRAIIRTELTELVNELALVGGPRVLRVDTFFEKLLGDLPPKSFDPENVAGQMQRLGERFGLTRSRVNTLGEEQNFTNYLIMVDYVNSLYQSWDTKRGYFAGTQEPFLGTQLVLLSQVLDAILEQLRETYDAMDSVFFGPAERQTTEVSLPSEGVTMTVAEILSWVETFAAVEGRQLIQDAGKDGVVIFRSTIERLARIVKEAADKAAQPSNNPSRPFHTRRVANALLELASYLAAAVDRSKKIRRNPVRFAEVTDGEENLPLDATPLPRPPLPTPYLFKFEWHALKPPGSDDASDWQPRTADSKIEPGTWVKGTIYGLNLRAGLAFDFGDDIEINDIEYKSSQKVTVELTVDDEAGPGPRDLSAKDANKQIGFLPKAFTVSSPTQPPGDEELELDEIDPIAGYQGQSLEVALTGTNLDAGTGVSFGSGIYVKSIKYDSEASSMIVDITIDANAKPGARSVSVFSAHYPGVPSVNFTVEQTKPDLMEVAVMPIHSADGNPEESVEGRLSKKANKKRAAALKTKKGD